jgi:hypothetical protein
MLSLTLHTNCIITHTINIAIKYQIKNAKPNALPELCTSSPFSFVVEFKKLLL